MNKVHRKIKTTKKRICLTEITLDSGFLSLAVIGSDWQETNHSQQRFSNGDVPYRFAHVS